MSLSLTSGKDITMSPLAGLCFVWKTPMSARDVIEETTEGCPWPYAISFSLSTRKIITLQLLPCLCCFANEEPVQDGSLPKGLCPGVHHRIKTKECLFLLALSAVYIQGSSGNPAGTKSTEKTFLWLAGDLTPSPLH